MNHAASAARQVEFASSRQGTQPTCREPSRSSASICGFLKRQGGRKNPHSISASLSYHKNFRCVRLKVAEWKTGGRPSAVGLTDAQTDGASLNQNHTMKNDLWSRSKGNMDQPVLIEITDQVNCDKTVYFQPEPRENFSPLKWKLAGSMPSMLLSQLCQDPPDFGSELEVPTL